MTLTRQIINLGFRFIPGKPLFLQDADGTAKELRYLSVRSSSGQVIPLKRDHAQLFFPAPSGMQAVTTTTDAVYRDFYALSDNDGTLFLRYCSLPMARYMDEQAARIGLTGHRAGQPEGFFVTDNYTLQSGDLGETDVGRLPDGRFIVQSSPALSDDGLCERFYFDRMPTHADAEDAVVLAKMERDFHSGRHREAFVCADCGKPSEWLGIPGNLHQKMRLRLRRRCGCD